MASCGTISVVEAFSEDRVTVTSCSGLPSEATPGQEVDLTVTVQNNNDASADGSVVAETSDGTQVGSASFVTAGGQSSTVTITVTLPSSPGDYAISATTTGVAQGVGGLSLGTEGHSDRGRRRGNTRY